MTTLRQWATHVIRPPTAAPTAAAAACWTSPYRLHSSRSDSECGALYRLCPNECAVLYERTSADRVTVFWHRRVPWRRAAVSLEYDHEPGPYPMPSSELVLPRPSRSPGGLSSPWHIKPRRVVCCADQSILNRCRRPDFNFLNADRRVAVPEPIAAGRRWRTPTKWCVACCC